MLSVAELVEFPIFETLSEEHKRNKMVSISFQFDLTTSKPEFIVETYDGRWRFDTLPPAVERYNLEHKEMSGEG